MRREAAGGTNLVLAGLSNSTNQRREPQKTGNLKRSNGETSLNIINDLLGSYYFSIVFNAVNFTVCLLFLGSLGRQFKPVRSSLSASNCARTSPPRTQLNFHLLSSPPPLAFTSKHQPKPAQPPPRIAYQSSHPLLSDT